MNNSVVSVFLSTQIHEINTEDITVTEDEQLNLYSVPDDPQIACQ
jgi:hypothetical protein